MGDNRTVCGGNMIREFAFGISNRHFFQDSQEIYKWQFISKDTYISLYAYDETVIKYYSMNKTISGYDGPIYMPGEFLLDVDGSTVDIAQKKTIGLIGLLRDLFVPYNIYFS